MKEFRAGPPDFDQIGRFVASAAKKLAAAQKTLAIDEEACYQLAYESMLKASLGLMLSFGLRPRGLPGHHIAIIEFAGEKLDKEFGGLTAMFSRMRRKRHQALYDVAGFISRREAEQASETAERYLAVIRDEIHQRSPRGRTG